MNTSKKIDMFETYQDTAGRSAPCPDWESPAQSQWEFVLRHWTPLTDWQVTRPVIHHPVGRKVVVKRH